MITNFTTVKRHICNRLYDSNCFFYGSQQWSLQDEKTIEIFHCAWRKSIRRLWNLPWRTRSHLLPVIIDQPPFVDQLCDRFLKLCETFKNGDNKKLQFILSFSQQSDGIIGKNIKYIACRRNCEFNHDIPLYMKYSNIDNGIIAQADVIKELTHCVEQTLTLPGFNRDEINDLIFDIAIL